MPSDSTAMTMEKPAVARARFTNGNDLLPGVDGRSVWARLFRDINDKLSVHCGGADRMSEPERMTARRAAALEAELMHLEARFAQIRAENGSPSADDLDLYSRISNTQRRHFEALGMNKRARDLTPDLHSYLGKQAA